MRGINSWLTKALFACTVWCSQANGSPNIVLLYTDDQGWTGTSVQMDKTNPESKSDYYQTPAVETLASEGMVFSNAYAPSPMCSPSRASVQTGKSPAQLGLTDIIRQFMVQKTPSRVPEKWRRFREEQFEQKLVSGESRLGIPDKEVTIAEFIKSVNSHYVTAHFGKWHLGSGGPYLHGYDAQDGETWNSEGQLYPPNPKDTFGISDRAIHFLEKRKKDKRPYFLQVSYYAVHRDVIALPKTINAYKALPSGQRHKNPAHAAMTEDLDTSVGSILEAINRLGMEDSTYVFYMSDNGAYLLGITNNRPLAKGKAMVWEGGIRVPFIVKGPGIKPGSQSDVPVIGWDLFPTIADLIGSNSQLPAGIEGGSLRSVLTENTGRVERLRGEQLVWFYPHYQDSIGVTPQSAIRIGKYKLIEEFESGEMFLYDLSSDLSETTNLVKSMPSKANELHTRLHSYLREVDAKYPTQNSEYCGWCFWE